MAGEDAVAAWGPDLDQPLSRRRKGLTTGFSFDDPGAELLALGDQVVDQVSLPYRYGRTTQQVDQVSLVIRVSCDPTGPPGSVPFAGWAYVQVENWLDVTQGSDC